MTLRRSWAEITDHGYGAKADRIVHGECRDEDPSC